MRVRATTRPLSSLALSRRYFQSLSKNRSHFIRGQHLLLITDIVTGHSLDFLPSRRLPTLLMRFSECCCRRSRANNLHSLTMCRGFSTCTWSYGSCKGQTVPFSFGIVITTPVSYSGKSGLTFCAEGWYIRDFRQFLQADSLTLKYSFQWLSRVYFQIFP